MRGEPKQTIRCLHEPLQRAQKRVTAALRLLASARERSFATKEYARGCGPCREPRWNTSRKGAALMQTKLSLSLVSLVALSSLAVLSGCSKKVPECNSITGVINPAADKLNAAKKAKGPDEEKAMKEARTTLEQVDASLGKLELTLPELQKFVKEYRAMSQETTKAMAELEKLSAGIDKQSKAVEAASKRLTAASEKTGKAVEAHGAAEAAAVKQWSDAYAKFPKEPDDKTVPDVLKTLEAIAFKDEGLKAAAAEEIAAHREMHKALVEMKAIVAKTEALGASVDKSSSKEGPLVEGLNKFCTGG